MRIVEINSVNSGSTGSIMRDVAAVARSKGHDVLVCYPQSRDNQAKYERGDFFIGNRYFRNVGRLISKYFRAEHFIHIISTLSLILRLEKFKPDVVHIHNIHDSFLNLPLLVFYLKRKEINVVWTLHDCWLYTGHCPYYVEAKCYRWKDICCDCKLYRSYPQSYYDDSTYKFTLKKKLLLSIGNRLTLVPVSSWLANEVSKSFLKDVRCQVVSNGIDMEVFSPKVDALIKKKYGIPNGKIILAAATDWGERKGLNDYYKLAKMLSVDEHIVLVGVTDAIIEKLPENIIGIKRTDNKEDMAKLYSIADVVLSLSYAETFGLTIVEANACGTPVVVYNNTAQPELVADENGIVVKTGYIKAVYGAIRSICSKDRECWRRLCRDKVLNRYSKKVTYQEYIELFKKITKYSS